MLIYGTVSSNENVDTIIVKEVARTGVMFSEGKKLKRDQMVKESSGMRLIRENKMVEPEKLGSRKQNVSGKL